MIPLVQQDAERLQSLLGEFAQPVVAFSGGVDSSVVAAAAYLVAPATALAVTAQSPSVPRWQLETARAIAAEIGIEHRVMRTDEGDREPYRRNDSRRCFFCKQTLYSTLENLTCVFPEVTILSGTNADDLGDYRPGIEAGRQSGVLTPLADLGIGKHRVRELARYYSLSNAALPASPCLASRIAYGVEVTPERLRRIEQAEDWLRQKGFRELRVRLHPGEAARIEVGKQEIERLITLNEDDSVTRAVVDCGFLSVTIDPEGFRSGNLNQMLVSLDQIPLDSSNRRVLTGTEGGEEVVQ